MKRYRARLVLASSCVLLTAAAQQAQDQSAADGQAESQFKSPLATDKQRHLLFLVGDWQEEIRYPSAKPSEQKVAANWRARPILGHYLYIEYERTSPRDTGKAVSVLGYDNHQERYRMWRFNSAGTVDECSGDFTDSNSLVVECDGQSSGKASSERARFIRVSQDEVDTTVDRAEGKAGFKVYSQAVAHRVADKGAAR